MRFWIKNKNYFDFFIFEINTSQLIFTEILN